MSSYADEADDEGKQESELSESLQCIGVPKYRGAKTRNFPGSNFLRAKTFRMKCAKPLFCLSRHCQRMRNECPCAPTPLTESQQISPNRAKNGVGVLNKTHGKLCRSL